MDKKDFNSITINELVKVAGVCRASFYRNFISLESIVDFYYREMFAKIYPVNRMTESNMAQTVKNIFSSLKSMRKPLSVLSKQNLLNGMEKYVFDTTLNKINELGVMNNRYQPYFFAGASFALIKAWIEFDFCESEDEMTEIFFKSLKGYL
ncbi:MAG: TetR/AcrR family transcriptional regulator [Firmicutes bacterium]|nr:TetR/AcrR family transcriptional regulator [Bacillota bacterium]